MTDQELMAMPVHDPFGTRLEIRDGQPVNVRVPFKAGVTWFEPGEAKMATDSSGQRWYFERIDGVMHRRAG